MILHGRLTGSSVRAHGALFAVIVVVGYRRHGRPVRAPGMEALGTHVVDADAEAAAVLGSGGPESPDFEIWGGPWKHPSARASNFTGQSDESENWIPIDCTFSERWTTQRQSSVFFVAW